MRINIMGRRWQLKHVSNLTGPQPQPVNSTIVLGKCYHDTKEIAILSGMDEMDEMDTYIHEVTHAACPFLEENFVKQFSNDLTKVLWDLGYRKGNND
jgi:hypothetical protein